MTPTAGMRIAAAVFCVLVAGCTKSFVPDGIGDRCDLPDGGFAPCPAGTYCGWTRAAGVRTCRTLCDGVPGSVRCPSGEACAGTLEPAPAPNPFTCWTGGESGEGEDCTGTFGCARGLVCVGDLSSISEVAATCEPVCNSDADCTRAGETCVRYVFCAAPCDPADPSTCPDGAVCRRDYCEYAPRAADCDRDSTPECPLGEICYDFDGVTCYAPIDFPVNAS